MAATVPSATLGTKATSMSTITSANQELSVEGRIGIGVGVGLGTLMIICASILAFFYRRRWNRQSEADRIKNEEPADVQDSGLAGSTRRSELPAEERPVEMADTGAKEQWKEAVVTKEPAELPADS